MYSSQQSGESQSRPCGNKFKVMQSARVDRQLVDLYFSCGLPQSSQRHLRKRGSQASCDWMFRAMFQVIATVRNNARHRIEIAGTAATRPLSCSRHSRQFEMQTVLLPSAADINYFRFHAFEYSPVGSNIGV